MNKREKELIELLYGQEQDVLKELEKQYRKTLDEINVKIRILQSDELTQSKVYQLQYQQALKKQIEGLVEKLHGDEYTTIQQYLHDSYTNSFIGTMYDMAGQGIPMILPINQEAAVKAILTDSKLSEGLYDALGVDTNNLKKTIRSEITRGIAGGMSYNDIARNITNTTKTPLSNARRIVQTEGHRIQQAATYDAQQASKAKGADVVKQWDSTLDGKTRATHRKLDGQIREVEKPFEMDGMEAMFPGDFGYPAEDCNCRCVSLTRARWALDEDELQRLKDRAEFFGLDKTKDFEDFQKKYLNAAKSLENSGKNSIIKVSNTAPTNANKTSVVNVDSTKAYQAAKDGVRHGGIYRDALNKSKTRLQKSIKSHEEQVAIHADKIANPEKYDKDWNSKTQQEKDGLLKKWRKDMQRNAEQAAIEKEVFRERFGEGP